MGPALRQSTSSALERDSLPTGAAAKSGADVPLAFVMTFPVITGLLWDANYITPPAGNVNGECPAGPAGDVKLLV